MKQNLQARRDYLNNLNSFSEKHNLEYVAGKGYKVIPKAPKEENPKEVSEENNVV